MTLSEMAIDVLKTSDPHEKARKTQRFVAKYIENDDILIGLSDVPDRPNRPDTPILCPPSQMPKRGKGGSEKAKIALLHALAHIELNAIDLSWDIIARFAYLNDENRNEGEFSLPRAFFDDWCNVARDEAKHFLMLSERLASLGAAYGDLPAHDGLWESAEKTAHDIAARLAVVPMVLEARGLDVTPSMIQSMKSQNDHITADLLQIIHDEEITHVGAGTRWFKHYCDFYDKNIETTWQALVNHYFNGVLKRPFNDDSREKAGMIRDWYEKLADAM